MTFAPLFPGPIEGWTVNFIRKQLWKVEASMEFADLMQEAYMVFLRVQQRYPDVETPQHFMALYKTSWFHHFTNLTLADSRQREVMPVSYSSLEGHGAELLGSSDNDGYLRTLIRQAPREVALVFSLFLNAPSELVETALSSWQGRDLRRKDGGSRKICQLLGLPLDLDVMKMVEEYLLPTE
jgi:hypothetical protein